MSPDAAVATVAGTPVRGRGRRPHEAALRGAPQCPAAGRTSEGQATAALADPTAGDRTRHRPRGRALGVTVTATTPTQDEVLPDPTARLEIGSIAASVLTDPLARAVFDHITRDVDVDEAEVADYHARNPRRVACPCGADGWLPPRPDPASTRCAHTSPRCCAGGLAASVPALARRNAAPSSCCWPPATSTPATRASPTTPTKHWMARPPGARHQRRQDRRRPRRPRRPAPAPRPASPPRTAPTPTRCGPPPSARITDRWPPPTAPSPASDLLGGPIDLPAGTISPINIVAWRGFPRRDRVAAAVPGVPVRLAGDGLCMALGEHWRGAGQGAAFLLGMVVSTGIGGGWCSTARLRQPHRQRRARRSRRRRRRRPTVQLQRTRLRRGHRQRTAPGGVGPGGGWTAATPGPGRRRRRR